jgi:hypothetical protein
MLDPHTHVREIMIQSATKERYVRRVHPNPRGVEVLMILGILPTKGVLMIL